MIGIMNNDITIWSDGSCLGNPGPGGYAALIEGKFPDYREMRRGGHPNTTNNRMELLAVVDAIGSLGGRRNVTLYSDSAYVVNGMSAWIRTWSANGWKTGHKVEIANRDLWEELWQLIHQHEVLAVHVPRNSTSEMLLVDGLARGIAIIEKEKSDDEENI